MTPWTAARQASLSFTISCSLLKLVSIDSMIPSAHLTLCHPLLFLPSSSPRTRVFFSELAHWWASPKMEISESFLFCVHVLNYSFFFVSPPRAAVVGSKLVMRVPFAFKSLWLVTVPSGELFPEQVCVCSCNTGLWLIEDGFVIPGLVHEIPRALSSLFLTMTLKENPVSFF